MTGSRLEPDVLVMKRTLIIVSAIVAAGLVLATTAVAGAAPTSPSTRLVTLDKTLLIQINALRRTHALSPLKLSKGLTLAADQHTTEMGQAGYFAHDSIDHTPFSKRIEQSYPANGHRSWSVGENLLFVSPDVDASQAIKLWMNSPGHRANLLDPSWREIGIATRHSTTAPGIYGNEAVTILTTDFGARH